MSLHFFVAAGMATTLFALGSATAVADELPSPLRLNDLLVAVRQRNPEIVEALGMARAAAARPRAAGLLEDPMLSLEWWQQPVTFANVPLMLTVRQPLPWPGRLRVRRQVAEREAVTARDRIGETARRIEAQAKRAYYDLALAESELDVNTRIYTLVDNMVRTVEARYKVGKATQAEILKTQSDLLTVENERLDFERNRDEARTRINALLNRAGDATVPPTAALGERVSLAPIADLIAAAAAHRPEVQIARDALAEAEARLASDRRESNPELAVWAAYQVNIHSADTFTLGASTTLPFFSSVKRRFLVDAADAVVRARRAAIEATTRAAERDVRTAIFQIDTADRHARLHADKLIPLAELSLQSAEAAYQNNRIDLFAVLDAAKMVRDHHLNHARYLIEYQRRIADLEQALGEDLPREVAR